MMQATKFTWLIFALISAIFTALRYLYIKKWCRETPSEILIFVTRLFGSIVYLPILLTNPIKISDQFRFWPVLALTIILTAAATIVQIRILQQSPISKSVPYLSFIPILTVPWTVLILKECPSMLAFAGIVLSCCGVYLLNTDSANASLKILKANLKSKVSLYMLFAVIILGLTTTCDKIAITASSAYTYASLWAMSSAVFMAGIAFRSPWHQIKQALLNRHSLIQAVFWASAFLMQMVAVQTTFNVSSGVTYVKALTLFSIPIITFIGSHYFKEGNIIRNFVASMMMVFGAIIVVASC